MTVGTIQRRLAAWADSRLLFVVLVILLGVDVGVGLNWCLAAPRSLSSPVYDDAKRIAPMFVYGLVFCATGLCGAVVVASQHRGFLAGYLSGALPGGLWLFWGLLFLLAPIHGAPASYLGAIAAAGFCLLHLIVGLAVAHRPPGA